MKKHLTLLFSSVLLLTSACQTTNLPLIKNASPTPPLPSTTMVPPTRTEVPKTNTPAPTTVPTSEPLVLTDEAFVADIQETCETDVPILGFEDGVFSLGDGSISFRSGQLALWCYGAKHQWIGEIEYAGYIFASSEDDPVQFQVIQDLGYQFTGGIGRLTYPDGTQVELYRPTTFPGQSTASGFDNPNCQTDNGKDGYVQFSSPNITRAVLVDGVISSENEWANAICVDIRHYEWGDLQNGKALDATWWVQNDEDFIYYLVRVTNDTPIDGVAVDYFWPEYTGTWAHSDGVYVNISGFYQDLANWDESKWYNDSQLTPPGSMNVVAAASSDNSYYWFEIKKALNSGDRYDWAVAPGQVIGYNPLDSFLFALILEQGIFFTRNLQIELGVNISESRPSATPKPTATPEESLQPVGVLNANANLRSGPGVVYSVIVSLTNGTKITALERNPDSTWLRIEVDATGQLGWISKTLVTYEFNVESLPVAQVIPPTPTFAPVEPTKPAVPLTFDTHIAVTNKLNVSVTVKLTGSYTTSFTVQPGQTIQVDVPAGTYGFSAYAYGFSTLTGSKTWGAGEYTWEFYVS